MTRHFLHASVNQSSNHVQWGNHTLYIKNILQGMYNDDLQILITLSGDTEDSSYLTCISYSGSLIFKTPPPDGWIFSYLTDYPKINIAVVCSSHSVVEIWQDWHFGIDLKNGNLFRYCPAY